MPRTASSGAVVTSIFESVVDLILRQRDRRPVPTLPASPGPRPGPGRRPERRETSRPCRGPLHPGSAADPKRAASRPLGRLGRVARSGIELVRSRLFARPTAPSGLSRTSRPRRDPPGPQPPLADTLAGEECEAHDARMYLGRGSDVPPMEERRPEDIDQPDPPDGEPSGPVRPSGGGETGRAQSS